MSTATRLEFHETSGSDGVVRLAIPVEEADKRYRVVLTVEPETAKESWEEFLNKIVGSWVGDFNIEEVNHQ